MPCQACEERRKQILEQIAAANAAARAKAQAFMEAFKNRKTWQETQDKRQQS